MLLRNWWVLELKKLNARCFLFRQPECLSEWRRHCPKIGVNWLKHIGRINIEHSIDSSRSWFLRRSAPLRRTRNIFHRPLPEMHKASSPGLRLHGAALKILSRVGEKWRERVGARWMISRRESLSRREQKLRNSSYGLSRLKHRQILSEAQRLGNVPAGIVRSPLVRSIFRTTCHGDCRPERSSGRCSASVRF